MASFTRVNFWKGVSVVLIILQRPDSLDGSYKSGVDYSPRNNIRLDPAICQIEPLMLTHPVHLNISWRSSPAPAFTSIHTISSRHTRSSTLPWMLHRTSWLSNPNYPSHSTTSNYPAVDQSTPRLTSPQPPTVVEDTHQNSTHNTRTQCPSAKPTRSHTPPAANSN